MAWDPPLDLDNFKTRTSIGSDFSFARGPLLLGNAFYLRGYTGLKQVQVGNNGLQWLEGGIGMDALLAWVPH